MNKLFNQTHQKGFISEKPQLESLENHYYSSPELQTEILTTPISPAFTPKLQTPKKSITPLKTPILESQSPEPMKNQLEESSFEAKDFSNNTSKNIFVTPQKPKKDFQSFSSRLLDTAITSTSTPGNIFKNKPSLHQQENEQFLDSGEKRKEKKEMIVDDWAIYTEVYVKRNIIMNEFYKMVRPKKERRGQVVEAGKRCTTRKRLKMESVC